MDDDDDEFGDLYTDVLRPISFPAPATVSSPALAPPPPAPPPVASSSAAAQPRPDPALSSSSSSDGDGEGKERSLFFSSGSVPASSIASQTLASPPTAAAAVKDAGGDDDDGGGWMHERDPLVAEATENWGDDEDEVVPVRPANGDAAGLPREDKPKVLEEDDEEEIKVPGISGAGAEISSVGGIEATEEVQDLVSGAGTGEDPDELDRTPAIPGISTGPFSSGTFPGMIGGDMKPEQSEDWDSDSEDDLQIVLNDNNHGLIGVTERNNANEADDDDDGEEDLIIVTEDQHHHLPITDEQQWGEEAMQPTGDGDKKETGDIPKGIGAPGTVAGARVSYSGHGFHAQHHSLYKQYIRPGATSVTGGPVAGAPLSATRPPLTSGPIAGRGRGEWRPAGGRGMAPGQKSYHTGFGLPNWASGSGVRAFGSSLDFTLPAHKTIFDVDIESFDEKPWKYPGADVSDFFNFALDEDKWKDYCKQLEQLRLEATMQSKIRVYESGRSEQEYDPDLPPELAAAAGHHDVSADGGHGKADNGQVDFNAQGRGPTTMRPPIPTGRAIQVESGYGERLPSIDTRPPRTRDSDAIIEIVLQDSFDDLKLCNGLVEQPEKSFPKDHMDGLHGDEDERRLGSEYSNRPTHTFRGQNRGTAVSEGDLSRSLPSGSPAEYHRTCQRSPLHSDTPRGLQNGERLPRGHSQGRCDTAHEHLDDVMPGQSAHKCLDDNEEEKLADDSDINQTSEVSAAIDDTGRELSMEQNSDEKHENLALTDVIEDDTNFDLHSTKTGDDKLAYSGNKLKLSSQVAQPDVRDAGDEGDLRASNSDSSRAKSGSSREYPRRHENSEEVLQGPTSRIGDFQRHHEGEEPSYRRRDDYGRGTRQDMDGSHIFSKRREDMPHLYQHREWDSNSANPGRGRSFEKAESEVTAHRRREDSIHGRRVKAEDMRGETSDETIARQRGKLRSVHKNNKDGDLHSKKQSDDRDWRGHGREGSSRQREKDNYLTNRRETLDDPLIKRKNQEDPGQKKRERGDITDHRKRDESTRMREKADDHYSAKHRDDSWRYKERDDKERLKQSREGALSQREREQRQGILKTTREGKPLSGDVRYNEELTVIGSDKDYQDKDRRMPSNNIRRGERTREDTMPQRKGRGNALSREKQSNTDERGSRHERINLYDDRLPSASSNQQLYKERHRENMKKNKDTDVNEQSSQVLGKRKHEDNSSRRTEKAVMKGLNKLQNNNISFATSSKKDGRQVQQQLDVQQANTSLRKKGEEDPASDDENQPNSRRGRSKLERWTSNKERDYGVIDSKQKLPLPPSRPMDMDSNDIGAVHSEELHKTEANNSAVDVDVKVVDSGNPVEKTEEDRDPHLDTVAKLKRRSERFKLPMPGDKDMASDRKQDNELQTPQSEAVVADSEVRPERPARKRRWTGS